MSRDPQFKVESEPPTYSKSLSHATTCTIWWCDRNYWLGFRIESIWLFCFQVRQHPIVLGVDDVQRGYIGCMDDVRMLGYSVPLHKSGPTPVAVLKQFLNVGFSCDHAMVSDTLP